MYSSTTQKKHRKSKKGGKPIHHQKTHKKHKRTGSPPSVDESNFLNCSPVVKGKSPISGSCFPESVLRRLKDSYNKQYPHNTIHTNDPEEIWKELKGRMSVCTKEDCWLKVIQSKEERKKFDHYLFAPDQPNEWKEKPNAWLSNYDIMEVLKQYEEGHPEFKMIGPTPIDFDDSPKSMKGQCVWKELCTFDVQHYMRIHKTKLGVVFNLDKHNGPGTHWVSLFVDFENEYLFYMDSAGQRVPRRIHRLVKKIQKQAAKLTPSKKMKFYQNHPMEHQKGNTECGMYSLYFLITMLTGETEGGQLNTPDEKIAFFKKERIPDSYIEQFRNVYFNKETE
jgi:hypothetical protein